MSRPSIIGVHGVGNFRPGHRPTDVAAHLAALWSEALATGATRLPPDIEVRVAYYAHHLHRSGAQSAATGLEALTAAERRQVRQWLDLLGLEPGVGQGAATMPIRQALSWLATRRGLPLPALEAFVWLFFHEVSAYFASVEARRAAQRELLDVLTALPEPRILLAHSLGSVVAHEALWSAPDIPVELLVTLGSPLALPGAVFDKLLPGHVAGRGSAPPGLRQWVNLADVGDLVALPVHGIPMRFDGVHADHETGIHTFDFHRALNYLRSDALSQTLRPHVA